MRVLGLSGPALVAVDAAASVVIQVAAGYLVHCLPVRRFAADRRLFRTRPIEAGGRTYERVLRIRRWKRWLPEAGGFFRGGFDKSHLPRLDDDHLSRYVAETRRAELGHWLAAAPAPLFFLFNPWYAGLIVQVYAVAVNGPCIAAQRYNRLRLQRLLSGRARRQSRKIAER
ncbi:MAG: glycosyl-4,4'-diaponeurosporenoate acyltransferase [Acidimicrobiales bacterium]